MDRYVLVCNIEGNALKFHEKLTTEVCSKFDKKRQKLPSHFTLKAPFETDKVNEMVGILEKFANTKVKTPIRIQGYGKFRRDVVYLDVKLTEDAKKVHDELMDELIKIPWLEFKPNEGKGKVFHCTIVSRKIQDKFNEIWNYVNQFECDFSTYFDNLSLYKWENNTWKLSRRFDLRSM